MYTNKDVVLMSKDEKKGEETKEIERPRMRRGLVSGVDSLFDSFRRDFDDLMNVWWPTPRLAPISQMIMPSRAPLIDLIDKGDHYHLTIDLPGMSKENINIQLKADSLEISGEVGKSSDTESEQYVVRERGFMQFSRTISFPQEIKSKETDATFKDGILTIIAPKKEPKPPDEIVKLDIKEAH